MSGLFKERWRGALLVLKLLVRFGVCYKQTVTTALRPVLTSRASSTWLALAVLSVSTRTSRPRSSFRSSASHLWHFLSMCFS
jgi:hypothetical protein